MTLEQLVEEHYDQLNENDLYIWQYIYHHKRQCQKMSIQELARACNVSHTSIIRFTKKIGLDGYSELKVYLKWSLEKKTEFDSTIIPRTTRELHTTIDMLEEKDLDSVLELIHFSKRIFVYGSGQVQHNMAQELKKDFAYCKKIVHVVEGVSEMDTVLRYASREEDIFILISLSGDNGTVVTMAKALQQMKIKTIGIALDTNNLLAKYSDEFIGFKATPFQTGFYDLAYTCTGHFFLIVSLLFLRYLEYYYAMHR